MGDSVALNPAQRIAAFLMTFLFGMVCLGIAMAIVPTLVLFPKKFAFFVTAGTFSLVLSTAFLIGVKRQLRSMTESSRMHAAFTFVLSMVMTLVSAVYWRSYVLSLAFAALQIASFGWYTLSYIPFARQFVTVCWGMISKVLGPLLSVAGSACGKCCGMCGKAVCRATG